MGHGPAPRMDQYSPFRDFYEFLQARKEFKRIRAVKARWEASDTPLTVVEALDDIDKQGIMLDGIYEHMKGADVDADTERSFPMLNCPGAPDPRRFDIDLRPGSNVDGEILPIISVIIAEKMMHLVKAGIDGPMYRRSQRNGHLCIEVNTELGWTLAAWVSEADLEEAVGYSEDIISVEELQAKLVDTMDRNEDGDIV